VDGEERETSDSLRGSVTQLLATPQRVGFYRAVELLVRATAHTGADPVGSTRGPEFESIRFRHDPSLVFSASDVTAIARVERKVENVVVGGLTEAYFEVTTTFLGLTGTVSPLPAYFAEEVIHEDPDHPAQRQFLDLFHHRSLSLFYRAHSKYSFVTDYESSAGDAWSRRSLCLTGFDGFGGLRAPAGMSLQKLLRLAPLLATRSRTADGLIAAVADVLAQYLNGAPVDVKQFVGRWVTIDERQLLRLGRENCTLGEDAVIGRRVFDRGGKFRIVLGPLENDAFRQFLPGARGLTQLRDLVSLYVRDPLEFDVELILAKPPVLRLGSSADRASRLGLDSWLRASDTRETSMIVQVPSETSSSAAEANDNAAPALATSAQGGAPHGLAR
jgi:type VI secretion system protein ImpH